MDIEFHCEGKSNFIRANQVVTSFSYKEYSIPLHSHDFYEINIVLKGKGSHQIGANSKAFQVKQGDVFVIPPMVAHSYFNTERLEVYHILLKSEFIRTIKPESSNTPGFLQLMEIEPFLRQSSNSCFLHLSQPQLDELQGDFKFIEKNSIFNADQFSQLEKYTALKIIHYLSYLLYEQNNKTTTKKEKYSEQILNTLEYISKNYSKKITINLLANRLYLSKSTFLRHFQSICGCSPMEYLREYRLKEALGLLENSTLSKSEIASFCGFYDLSHLEKAVRLHRDK